MSEKLAVILFNLGGPANLEAVKPFLFNLFYDKAIIRLPNPLRYLVAKLISGKRTETAKEIYQQMGGKSPILEQTMAQAKTLEENLAISLPEIETKAFVVMRYAPPRAQEVAKEVLAFAPDRIVFLPLYPQCSSTTTLSSLKEWKEIWKGLGGEKIVPKETTICCYPTEVSFIEAHAETIRPFYRKAKQKGAPRLLFSAHGLPESVIKSGDPYQWQVEQSAAAIVAALNIPNLDWRITYQSRVGPMKWIEPYTDKEIIQAAKEKTPLVIVPIAFVSEHSETLVELDIEYRHLAEAEGLHKEAYQRAPAITLHEKFIESMTAMVVAAVNEESANFLPNGKGKRLCPPDRTDCPCRAVGADR
jgi:protoporphyrin/coproporphyrin ferrochelatase